MTRDGVRMQEAIGPHRRESEASGLDTNKATDDLLNLEDPLDATYEEES